MKHSFVKSVLALLLVSTTLNFASDAKILDRLPGRKKTPANIQGQMGDVQMEAGRARIKAAKAKKRLDTHIYESEKKRQELEADFDRAEREVKLLDEKLAAMESRLNRAQTVAGAATSAETGNSLNTAKEVPLIDGDTTYTNFDIEEELQTSSPY